MSESILNYFGIFKEPIIGLDISGSAVKVLEISEGDNGFTVEKYGVEALQPGCVVEGHIKEPEQIGRKIIKALAKADIKSKRIAISMPNSESITKTIQINNPDTTDDVMGEIELEADRYIPYPLSEVYLDFELIGENKKNPDLVDIIIAVSKKEHLNYRVELLNSLDLNVSVVDIDYFSLARTFKFITKDIAGLDNKIVALIDIGSNITSISIFEHNKCIYNKEQSFGGEQLIEEIQNRYGLNHDEALIAHNLGELPEDYTVEILNPFKQKCAQNVARICQFFLSSGEYNIIDYIYLTGGTCNIPDMGNIISEKTNAKVLMANPFTNMRVNKNIKTDQLQRDSFRLLNCCGLALRNTSLGQHK